VSAGTVAAEQAVLGSCLIEAGAYAKIIPKLTPRDFSRTDHQTIFAAITTLAGAGKAHDHVTVAAQLEREGRLADAGGVAYLSQLARETPTAANVATYAAFVHDHRGPGNGAGLDISEGITPVLRAASDIEPRELEPLWPGVLWIGKPTLLVGDPGLGKSLATVDIAARVSRGAAWPCETGTRKAGNVLMLSAEDDPEDTIVPRLIAAGADLTKIAFFDAVRVLDERGTQHDAPIALDQHMEALCAAIKPGTQLVTIDPISAFLGRTDSHNNAEIRAVLAGVGRLAMQMRFAALGVSHLNKVSGTSAVYRVTGSLAFVAAARAVFAIARDPDQHERRLMLPIKSNLGPDTNGYGYTVSVADNDAPYVKWADERVTRTAEEVLTGTVSPREQAIIERGSDVRDWLREELRREPRPAADMWRMAEERGFSRRDVNRAKLGLGITAEPLGFRAAWHWRLPKPSTQT
jgi:putative DNA primase/helicase